MLDLLDEARAQRRGTERNTEVVHFVEVLPQKCHNPQHFLVLKIAFKIAPEAFEVSSIKIA